MTDDAAVAGLLAYLRGESPPPMNREYTRVIERIGGLPAYADLDIADARLAVTRFNDKLRGDADVVDGVSDWTIPSAEAPIPARRYGRTTAAGTILFLHGGGFVMGDIEIYDAFCRRLVKLTSMQVISLAYRLAPEHPFPAGLSDALVAIDYLGQHAGKGALVIMGDSSGGNLAAVCAMHARDAGSPSLALQVLIYPVVGTAETVSRKLYGRPGAATRFLDMYLAGADATRPDVAPILSPNFTGLAPAIVVVAEYDTLRDESLAYARKLARAGVPVAVYYYADMPHGFIHRVNAYSRAADATEQIATAIRSVIANGNLAAGDLSSADLVNLGEAPASRA
jgi:acetyl esterase